MVLGACLFTPTARADEVATAVSDAPASSAPTAAIDWADPAIPAAVLRLERLELELTPWGQIDYSVRLNPVVRFQEYPNDGEPGNVTSRLTVSARVDFAPPPATHARALQSLERGRLELARLRVRSSRDALLAHAQLLVAQEQRRASQRALALQEQGADGGGADSRGAERARLADLEAELALERAREAARAYGLEPAAHFQSVRFLLPDTSGPAGDPFSSHEYRLLELEALEARAELDQLVANPLDDLRLRAAYRTRGGQLALEGGLVNGRPATTLNLAIPGGPERWEVQVSAQLVLDDSLRELKPFAEALVAAEAELTLFARRFTLEIEYAADEARLAEMALDLAEEEMREAEVLASTGQDSLAAALAAGQEAEGSIEQLMQRAARAERDLGSARMRLYRRWIAYIRATASLLEITGSEWQVRNVP